MNQSEGVPPDLGAELTELAARVAMACQDISDVDRALYIENQCALLLRRNPRLQPTKLCLFFGLAVGSALERVESHLIDISGGE